MPSIASLFHGTRHYHSPPHSPTDAAWGRTAPTQYTDSGYQRRILSWSPSGSGAVDTTPAQLYSDLIVSEHAQSNSVRNSVSTIATFTLYGFVILLFVTIRVMPETAYLRPLLLFAARYTSLIIRTLAFLALAALWNAAGDTFVNTFHLERTLSATPIRSLISALVLGAFMGPGRLLLTNPSAEDSRSSDATAMGSEGPVAYDRERTRFSAHPTAAVALLLSATAFHPAQIAALVWFLRDSTAAVVSIIALAVFTVLGTVILLELVVAGGLLSGHNSVNDTVSAKNNRASHCQGSGALETLTRFARSASIELYDTLRVFILAALVALAAHIATPLAVSQWLYSYPHVAMLLAAVLAVLLSPPVGGAAAIVLLFRGQLPLVALFTFLLVALTIRGGNLMAIRRFLGTRFAVIVALLVTLLIAVLLLPVVDLLSGTELTG